MSIPYLLDTGFAVWNVKLMQNRMSRRKLEKPEFPADWLNDELYHGFSKVGRTRRYRPVLSLNGAQYYFGECKTREEAARAYDALLKFFLAYSSSRAVPNFPEDFSLLSKDDALFFSGDGCLTHKKLLAIEEELSAQFEVLGRSVAAYKTAREKEIQDAGTRPSRTAKLAEAADNVRRRAMIKLEVVSLRNASTFDLTGLVRKLWISKVKWNDPEANLPETHSEVEKKFRDAQEALVCYVKKLKTALELDPDASTK